MDKPLSGRTILVVDDELATVVCRMIEQLGGRAIGVTSVAEAREVFVRSSADCAIVDLLLSNGNGAVLIREMRLLRSGFPCVLISGLDLPTVTQEGIKGVFLPKPFSKLELATAILTAIGSSKTDPPPSDAGEESYGWTTPTKP